MTENMPVYDYEDAINFISERCSIDKVTVEKILMLEEDYMRSIGIVTDELIYKDKVKEYLLSEDTSTEEIEDFLEESISDYTLEELECYIEQTLEQMPGDIIKDYYNKFYKNVHPVWKILNKEKYVEEFLPKAEKMYDFIKSIVNICGNTTVDGNTVLTMRVFFNMWNEYSSETFRILDSLVNNCF